MDRGHRPHSVAQACDTEHDAGSSGAQNLFEWLVEGLYGLSSVIGKHLVDRTFWFFATIFIFILAANWIGLIPGVGTIGWGHDTPAGFTIEEPLFRGANADLNLTLAMALIFFALWIVWAVQEVGVGGMIKELFGAKGETTGVMKPIMATIFVAAGLLEIISILFRPISLSFRLYGNIFAGARICSKPWPGSSRGLAGCCRYRSISWNCWWAWCRRRCSCC
jgi:F-type H+-transporting ATPase subunit a